MTALWTADEIAKAVGGTIFGAFEVKGVAFDSREIEPGDLFIALKGEANDGHRFADQAFAAGATGAIVSEPVVGPHILVDDTTKALDALGRAARARTNAQIVGITGSVGKTGTKEALFAALDRAVPDRVHRSVKSYNNHTGVPLSLSRMPQQSRYGVFEMGMNHAGELAALTQLVRPHVALVTAIAPAHREFFSSEEEIADAKGEIFEGLESGGTALIPHDSPHRDRLIAAASPFASRIWTFGCNEGADVWARDVVARAAGGTIVTASLPEAEITFTISQAGQHWVSNALGVLGVVEALGGDLGAAGLALADLAGIPGRGARHRIIVDGGEALLIDESYNANPASMEATLKTLGQLGNVRQRIAVLGSMRELGQQSDAFHAALAEPIEAAAVDYSILVGEEMAPLAKALGQHAKMTHVADVASAIEVLRGKVAPGDAILVKGSNTVGLGALVQAMTSGKI